MRPIYTALNEAAAKTALENLRRDFGKKSPGLVAAWDRAWDQFIPFLEFDSAIRKVIYTTNAIESVNFQLRKIIKNRGHFPGDDAAIKLLYLGIRNITGRHIDGDGLVRERGERGTGTYGWKAAMNAFAVAFGDRVPRLTRQRKTTHLKITNGQQLPQLTQKNWLCRTFGGDVPCSYPRSIRWRRRAKPARPYICLLIIFVFLWNQVCQVIIRRRQPRRGRGTVPGPP